MYAHRNEDIINGGGATTSTTCQTSQNSSDTDENLQCVDRKNKRKSCSEEDMSSSNREQKREKYKMLAKFKGMEILDFSRWILSASPFDREKLLRDFLERVK